MKILLGVLYYEPAWAYGGPPRLVSDLARQLASRGHQVTVCTTDALDAGRRIERLEEESAGVRVVRFRNLSNALAYRLKIFVPLGMKSWLARNVGAFDVVHLFDARTLLNAWAARAVVDHGVPFVLSAFGSLPAGTGWRAIVKRRFDRRHGGVLLGRATALLAQNEHERQLYVDYGADPTRVLLWPLAVDLNEYARLPSPGRFRERFGIGPEERVLLFVGRIHVLKGLEPLLHALAQTQRVLPRARLVVVGRDDGYLAEMLALARRLEMGDRLIFAGPLYGPDLLPAYVDCDLFAITPTHFEETSLASLGACACGRPVLINDRCGLPWLEEYRAGRCVSGGAEAIASAMTEMLGDLVSLAAMGRNARRLVEERFAWPQVVEQVEKIYASARDACSRRL
jgi:glycosyltransferase involved in cell wall biosynthesis